MPLQLPYCPRCGRQNFTATSDKSWQCSECAFLWYQNTAAAAAAIILHEGEILFAVRAGEPEAGRLDLPGGFVDNDESAEASLLRELDEELSLTGVRPTYLVSFPNTYPYGGVEYKTLDLFFLVVLEARPPLQPADDVAGIRWIPIDAIPFDALAFDSVRRALAYFLEQRDRLLNL